MSNLSTITLSELKSLFRSLKLPADTKLSVTFEDEQANAEILKRKTAISAMKKLKGSGNGNLVSVLLEERQKDKLE